MKRNLFNGLLGSVLMLNFLAFLPMAQSESRSEKKGEMLETKSEQLEGAAKKQEAEGHALRAGRDAKMSARKGARAEKKLKKAGVTPTESISNTTTEKTPVQ
jgi:hypothetical protein